MRSFGAFPILEVHVSPPRDIFYILRPQVLPSRAELYFNAPVLVPRMDVDSPVALLARSCNVVDHFVITTVAAQAVPQKAISHSVDIILVGQDGPTAAEVHEG